MNCDCVIAWMFAICMVLLCSVIPLSLLFDWLEERRREP